MTDKAQIERLWAVVEAGVRVDACLWAFADTLNHQGEDGCLTNLHAALDQAQLDEPPIPARGALGDWDWVS